MSTAPMPTKTRTSRESRKAAVLEPGSVQPAGQRGNPADHLREHCFRKGVSGNPGGKPKGLVSRVRENTRDGLLLIDRLVEIVKTGKDCDVVAASNLLFQRGWGKAPQTLKVNASVNEKRLVVMAAISRLPPEVVAQVCGVLSLANDQPALPDEAGNSAPAKDAR